MPTILTQLDTIFRQAMRDAFAIEADPLLSVSQNEKFGDYQSNAAMGLAKQIAEKTSEKTNPRQVAERIKEKLQLGEIASEVTIAGPGFVNVRLAPAWVASQVQKIANDKRLGVEPSTSPLKAVVDYSGPNVAKQMHVGHLRSTIIGDAISRVIEFQGHTVIRQNHLGDWGTQFGMLIAFLKWTGLGMDSHIEDLEDFYRRAKQKFDAEPEFQDEARATVVRLQGGAPEELAAWKQIVDETRRHYQPVYELLGVKLQPTDERGESFYNPMLPKVVSDLRSKGIATESEGAVVVFVEGFENPLIIEKSGGGYLYGTTDLAALRYRVEALGARRIVYTHDSRQAQHFAQVFWTARKAGFANDAQLNYAPFGTMLGEDGKPFKSREGGIIKLKDLLEEAEVRGFELARTKEAERIAKAKERGDTDIQELTEEQVRKIGTAVGIGGVKYADLSKDRVSDYVFAWDKMLSMDGNTAPYLQYAHARIKSIFRKSGAGVPAGTLNLESPYELALAKHILRLSEIIDLVGRELKPHHLTTYLYDLATRFSSFYENCPVLQSDDATRASRLLLCHATARTMELGLDLLGIEHPDQM